MKKILFILLFISSTILYGKPLIIGLTVAPPFAVYADNDKHFFGFAIDLMDEICIRAQFECTYVAIPLHDELDQIQKYNVDLAFTPIPITDSSSGKFLFSLPYLISDAQFITLKTSTINSIDDLKNMRIGVVTSTFYDLLQSSHYDIGSIQQFTTLTDLLSALGNNTVDAAFINNHIAQFIVNNSLENIKLIGKKIPLGEGYGLLALKTNQDLIDKVNSALISMENDGTYLKIYNLYFSGE